MIPVQKLVASLRFALRDMQGVNVSDFELLEAINQAASLLYGRLSKDFVQAVLKKKILIVDDSGNTGLPSDFVRVHQVGMGDGGIAIPTTYLANVEGTYRIIGNTFYAPEGAYGLEYYYEPARVKSLGDYLDVPESMSPYIEQISLCMFSRDLEKAELIIQECSQILAGRDISHYRGTSPTQILGGRV